MKTEGCAVVERGGEGEEPVGAKVLAKGSRFPWSFQGYGGGARVLLGCR